MLALRSLRRTLEPTAATQIPEPPLARFLFADTRMAWVWLLVRVYVGWQWLVAGVEKLTGSNVDLGHFGEKVQGGAWVFVPNTGAAIKGFAQAALTKASGEHPAVQGWYADFLRTFVVPHAGFWAYLVTFGEVAVGLGLLVGALTGIAAFFGVVMNFNYLLAGTVSINPILGVLGLVLVLSWRVAGYYGVDRYLLPLLGTPWTGSLTKQSQAADKTADDARLPAVTS
jgi:thiosulfate dehydrogenase (quinone) large subunit